MLCFSTAVAQSWNKPTIDSVTLALEHIFETDQTYRLRLDSLVRLNYNDQSLLRQTLTDSIRYYDSVNIINVKHILHTYGWLSESEVGREANLALFTVVQHADTEVQLQLEPIVHRAVNDGKLKPQHYALFKDRVLLSQGKKQLYGSQVGRLPDTGERYVMPLEDPDNVDARRKSMGLEPLSEYLKFWNLEWNAKEYKNREYPNIFATPSPS